MGILDYIFSPNLYFLYKQGGVVPYSPKALESIPNMILNASYFAIKMTYYLSPLIIYKLYMNTTNLLSNHNLLTGAKILTLSAALMTPLYLVRGIGRSMNPDYQEFMRILKKDREGKNTRNYQSLRMFDFDISSLPPAFIQSKSKLAPRTPTPPNIPSYSVLRYALLYGFILDAWHYLLAHSLGRAAIYPGSLWFVNSIVGIDCAQGRYQLLAKGGVRGKLLCKSGHSIDTIYVRQNETAYSDTLVICCEGNAGFMESASTHHFLGRGYSVLGWNHPGFQYSTGKPFPHFDQEAVIAAVQYAVEELHHPLESIIVYGWSIGGYSASYATAAFPMLKGLILDASFDDIVPLATAKMPSLLLTPVTEVLTNHFNLQPQVFLSQYNGPVTLIRRTKDDIITTDINNRAATNRGNDLLMSLLKNRYPFLFSIHECQKAVLLWLHLTDHERTNSEYNIDRKRMYDLIQDYSMTASLAPPCEIGRELPLQDQTALAVYLAMQYMKHFTSTHNTPVLLNLLDPPKNVPYNL